MRHTAASERGTWGTYVAAAIEAAGISKAELARRIETDVGTIFRWLAGKHAPERADVVARFADATGVDLDEALTAAGLRPAADPPKRPARQDPPLDPRARVIAENLQIISDRLNDPSITNDERLLTEAKLDMLVDLAKQVGRRPRAEA